MKYTLKEIVKGTSANLSHIRGGIAYYIIVVKNSSYLLGINLNDDEWLTTDLYPAYKAITLMRWIKKGIDNNDNTFIQLN